MHHFYDHANYRLEFQQLLPFLKILLIYFWVCWVFFAACRLSLVVASGGYSLLQCMCSHCGGFSCCGAQARCVGFSSCDTWLSSCGLWALEHRLSSCGARA